MKDKRFPLSVKYKVSKHNSTVCGYPGRDFDWTKFDWKGGRISKAIFKDEKDYKSPEPYTDDSAFMISPNCQYLHVAYDWAEAGTIYRVCPNPTMYAGQTYRGRQIKKQKAQKIGEDWYWVLIYER